MTKYPSERLDPQNFLPEAYNCIESYSTLTCDKLR